jgi:hypothetical protein
MLGGLEAFFAVAEIGQRRESCWGVKVNSRCQLKSGDLGPLELYFELVNQRSPRSSTQKVMKENSAKTWTVLVIPLQWTDYIEALARSFMGENIGDSSWPRDLWRGLVLYRSHYQNSEKPHVWQFVSTGSRCDV